MSYTITDRKFYNENRNDSTFASALGEFTDKLVGNVGEKAKAIIELDITLGHEVGQGATGTYELKAGFGVNKYIIKTLSVDWFALGFRNGDTFEFFSRSGGVETSEFTGTFENVTDGSTEIGFDSAGVVTVGLYDDAIIKVSTEFFDFTFGYNLAENPNSITSEWSEAKQLYTIIGVGLGGVRSTTFVAGVPASPENWNTGSFQMRFVSAPDGFTQKFELEHEFVITPYWIEAYNGNFNPLSLPDPYNNSTLSYLVDLDNIDTAGNRDLATFTQKASVGFFNENFEQGANGYTLASIDYTDVTFGNVVNAIEVNTTTRVTAVITGNFLTATPVTIHHSLAPKESVYVDAEEWADLWQYESLRNDIDAVANSGTRLTNYTIVLDNPTQITVTFDIVYSAGQKDFINKKANYLLYVALEDSTTTALTSDRVNLLLDFNTVTINEDETGLIDITKLEIYDHITDFVDGVSVGTTDIEGWIEDGILVDMDFTLKQNPTSFGNPADVDAFKMQFVAYNGVTGQWFVLQDQFIGIGFKRVTGATGQYWTVNYSKGAGFNLDSADQFNLFEMQFISEDGTNASYTARFGLKVNWKSWLALNNNIIKDRFTRQYALDNDLDELAIVDLAGLFHQTSEPIDSLNGTNQKIDLYDDSGDWDIRLAVTTEFANYDNTSNTKYVFFSPDLNIFDYDSNSGYTGTIATKDSADIDLAGNLIKDEFTKVVATFDDGTTKTDVADFEGIIRIEEFNQTGVDIHELSTVRSDYTGNLLEPLTGETLAKKSIVAGNYTIEALVDGLQLRANRYKLSARLYDLTAGALANTYSTEFDGVIQYGNMPFDANIQLDILKPLTISFYFKTTATVTGGIFDSRQSDAWKGGSIVVNSAGGVGVLIAEAFNVALNAGTTTSFNDGAWHHCIFVYDGGTDANNFIFNVDGSNQPINVGLNNATASHGKSEFYSVGRRGIFGFQYGGKMDEATFWDKALSPAEISELYNGGSVLDPTTHSASANLKTWLRFGDGDTLPTVTDNVGTNNVTLINGAIFVADAP